MWVTKSLQVERGGLDPARRVVGGQRQIQADPRLEQVDQHQAERERDQAGADEPGDARQPDPAERGDVAHMRDAGDQGREDQRSDDHLDQAEEDRRDDAQIVGDLLELRPPRRRPVVDAALIAQPAMMPSTSANRMYRVSFLANGSPLERHPSRWPRGVKAARSVAPSRPSMAARMIELALLSSALSRRSSATSGAWSTTAGGCYAGPRPSGLRGGRRGQRRSSLSPTHRDPAIERAGRARRAWPAARSAVTRIATQRRGGDRGADVDRPRRVGFLGTADDRRRSLSAHGRERRSAMGSREVACTGLDERARPPADYIGSSLRMGRGATCCSTASTPIARSSTAAMSRSLRRGAGRPLRGARRARLPWYGKPHAPHLCTRAARSPAIRRRTRCSPSATAWSTDMLGAARIRDRCGLSSRDGMHAAQPFPNDFAAATRPGRLEPRSRTARLASS